MSNKDELLVEGKSDQEFFRFLIKSDPDLELESIEISPPKLLGGSSDGVTGVLEMLPNLLKFKELHGKSLGIVLDADFQINGTGFLHRRNEVLEILSGFGYVTPECDEGNQWQGEIFQHSDGLSPVGLWIMPDHQSDGMFETLLLDTIKGENRQQLHDRLREEMNVVATDEQFQEIRFKDAHRDKVLLNTWLSWQKQPAACRSDSISIVECALREDWLDADHQNVVSLARWLQSIFTPL